MLQCLFRKLAVSFLPPLCFYSFFIFIHRSHCVCVCARELLLLYSTCEDIRLHLKSAKHRNKYLKEFSYNMQMSTHMPALIYPHTHTKRHTNSHTHSHTSAREYASAGRENSSHPFCPFSSDFLFEFYGFSS